MTQEETKAWVASLKPGDVVVHQFFHDNRILHIKKVTPTGIIRTREGPSFKFCYGGSVDCCGEKYSGWIVPATPELLNSIKEKETVLKAYCVTRGLYTSNMTVDFAKEFLELCQRHGIET